MSDFNYLATGEHNFKQFINIIKRLFVDENKKYDLVIGMGNTGLVMLKLNELILNELKIKMPPTLTLPLLRFSDNNEKELFNNDIFLEEVKKQIEGIEKIQNILFVDDEIYRGISLKTALGLLMKVKGTDHLQVTVVAEDQGFQWHNDIQNVDIEFCPFAHEVEGHNNVIFYMIPSEYDKPIKDAFPEDILKWHTRINILLGLPIKIMIDGKPEYTFKFNQEAEEKVANFRQLQVDFLTHLKDLIRKSIVPATRSSA
ncbi:hypothetical protein BH09PAT2_BH09PAT2_05890 [soil metagenome]